MHANDMGWGLCAASSRALRNVPGLTDRGQECPIMVPLIDLCQHSLDPNCHIRDYRVRQALDIEELPIEQRVEGSCVCLCVCVCVGCRRVGGRSSWWRLVTCRRARC